MDQSYLDSFPGADVFDCFRGEFLHYEMSQKRLAVIASGESAPKGLDKIPYKYSEVIVDYTCNIENFSWLEMNELELFSLSGTAKVVSGFGLKKVKRLVVLNAGQIEAVSMVCPNHVEELTARGLEVGGAFQLSLFPQINKLDVIAGSILTGSLNGAPISRLRIDSCFIEELKLDGRKEMVMVLSCESLRQISVSCEEMILSDCPNVVFEPTSQFDSLQIAGMRNPGGSCFQGIAAEIFFDNCVFDKTDFKRVQKLKDSCRVEMIGCKKLRK